jgi:Prokaryotic STING domain
MKPKDVLSFLKICLSGLGPLLVYIWFRYKPKAPGPDHDFSHELIIRISFCVVIIIAIWYMANLAKKIGKADGLAFGYYYNFIYESIKFIEKKGKIKQKNGAAGIEITSTLDNINILVVVPDNLHSYYLISDVVKNLLEEVLVMAPEGVRTRTKVWRWFAFNTSSTVKNVLVDIPPTTIKTLRLFRENSSNVDHYLHHSRIVSAKDQATFERVRKGLEGDIRMFGDSLGSILKKETDLRPDNDVEYDKIVLVKYAGDFIRELFDKETLEKLDGFSLNENQEFQDAIGKIDAIIQSQKQVILERMRAAILGTIEEKKRSRFQRFCDSVKRIIRNVVRFYHRNNPLD